MEFPWLSWMSYDTILQSPGVPKVPQLIYGVPLVNLDVLLL